MTTMSNEADAYIDLLQEELEKALMRAARADELERILASVKEMAEQSTRTIEIYDAIPELEKSSKDFFEEKQKLEDALMFYADPETYFAIGFFPDPPSGEFMDDFEEWTQGSAKPGKRARAALGIKI